MIKEIGRSSTKSAKKNKSKASPLWWRRLSLQEQVDYLEEHPRSKLKPNMKKPKNLPADVEKVIEEKAPEIVADLESAVDKAEKLWEQTVKDLSPEEVEKLSNQIIKAASPTVVEEEKKKIEKDGFFDDFNGTNFRRVAVGLAIAAKLGLLTVGAGALLAVNPSYVFLLPQIAGGIWRALPDGTFGAGLVLYMGHRMMDGMRTGLNEVKRDTKKLKESIVEAEPTTVASSSKSQETSNYSHYTDIIKSLSAIELEKVKLTADHLSYQTHPINRLACSLYLLYRVEAILPQLHNIYMTCTSQGHMQLKPRLQNNIYTFKEIRSKLKMDIRNLSAMINPDGIEKFGDKVFVSLKAQFPKLTITRHRTAIFDSMRNNALQVVHCYEFGTPQGLRRGSVTLYVHATELSYAIERSRDYTPNFLQNSEFSKMRFDIKKHISEVIGC